ncbi:MAG TPA: putative Fe-S cluster assembly protein SufT [Candidatus Sulfotelmatobacter sp.]|jgi:probable FeS assembly SUF system protein SufT|nr:putative Fe-S cluster assembly protein SufT [Candidatus Sulfotelmatobacter sp.]
MASNEQIALARELEVTQIPSGIPLRLAAGTKVRLMQALGGSYTVITDVGYMVRVDARDVDALGLTPSAAAAEVPTEFSEKLVWDQLRTVYDPEIPVNVVDLGLIYSCQITPVVEGNRIEIKMTMTAPGCGMSDVLKADIQRKLGGLLSVKEVQVEVVFDPPWNPTRMTEGARLQLGLDLESTPFPLY